MVSEANAEQSRGPGRHLTLERERDLRQRLVARDERALAELIESTSPWLLGVAQWMLNDSQEAEDVVQDVFVRLWQQDLSGEAGDGRLVPWLLRVTRTRCIDRLRRRRRRHQYEATLSGPAADLPITLPQEPNEAASPGWHVHRSIHEALATLPVEQQRVVHLAYFLGLSQSEVAERLQLPLGTVKTRTRLAFAHLRALLAPMKEWLV
ncbi:MAG: sigma-70 family RNA polymerase sigma factor [Gemmatimonadota bacterium]